MTQEQFLKALSDLKAVFASRAENASSFRVEGCVRCTHTTFSTGCADCHRCNYCTDCGNTTFSNHCIRCTDSHFANNCIDCRRVVHGSFLVLSESMRECTYCLGCVGLSGKDFHILNRPYERREYFELERKLLAALGIRR